MVIVTSKVLRPKNIRFIKTRHSRRHFFDHSLVPSRPFSRIFSTEKWSRPLPPSPAGTSSHRPRPAAGWPTIALLPVAGAVSAGATFASPDAVAYCTR